MLTPASIILKKRDGIELTAQEIEHFIKGITTQEVADYQATAFLMAVFFKGMSRSETVALTRSMLESGEQYDLSKIEGPKVDKHSTGGVGDKVSLILAPLAAACGLKVPMMSGRGLGPTGGTLDKLQSIQGFEVDLSFARFKKALQDVGCVMIGQSANIAPADRKLYSLRDVTGTVESIPLIVASILSKKLAEGTRGLVLDVKTGSGAFMKSRGQARKLAKTLIKVAQLSNLPCRAVLSSMDQPLGYSVGNSLEVFETIEVLRGKNLKILKISHAGSADLRELTILLCAHMLILGKRVGNLNDGRKLAHSKLSDGGAWKHFQRMVEAQGGSIEQIEDPHRLPLSPRKVQWKARKVGYICKIQTDTIGHLLVEMNGGRKRASDTVDPSVGFVFHKKLGARIKLEEPIVTVFLPINFNSDQVQDLEEQFHQTIQYSKTRKSVPKLIVDPLVN